MGHEFDGAVYGELGEMQEARRARRLELVSGGKDQPGPDGDIRTARPRRQLRLPRSSRSTPATSPRSRDRVILMYAKGMSTCDISDTVKGIYGFGISAEMVSNITDRVVDDLAERQNRPLKAMYSFMFVDCMHVNVKRERRSEKRAVYVALAYDLDGHKDVLDLWVGESEGKHFWMGVFDELHRRGIRRISTISETSRPRRNIRPIDAAKKKEGRNAPPSGQPVSRLPACQFALPETIGALWG